MRGTATPRRVDADLGAATLTAQLDRLRGLLSGQATSAAGRAGDAERSSILQSIDTLRLAVVEMRRSGEALAQEQQRWHELFDLAPDGYVVTDPDGVILEANLAAGMLLGAPAPSLAGKPMAAYLPGGNVHHWIGQLRRGERQTISWEAKVHPRRGYEITVTVRVGAGRDGAGSLRTVRWMLHDISERLANEAEARRGVEEHAERLAALEKRKGDFLRLASHELRSPLAVMYGYLSMILAGDFGELTPALSKHTHIVLEQSQFMARLIDQMLETARLDDARTRLDEAEADLRELALAAVDSPKPDHAAEQLQRIVVDLPDEPVTARVDRERVTGVVRNLLDNALKYSTQGPIVCSVRADRTTGVGMVLVGDTGPGIGLEARELLFERFGRFVSPETSNVPGTGLGLYISREVARLHGGELRLAGDPGDGATFVLELPLLDSAASG